MCVQIYIDSNLSIRTAGRIRSRAEPFEILPDFSPPRSHAASVISIGVALPGDFDVAHDLIERASTLASRFEGRWVAFVICNDGASSLPQAEHAMQRGGTVFFCEGEDVAETLLELAARERVDILILGAPERRRLLRRGTVERVVTTPRNFDVMVVGQR